MKKNIIIKYKCEGCGKKTVNLETIKTETYIVKICKKCVKLFKHTEYFKSQNQRFMEYSLEIIQKFFENERFDLKPKEIQFITRILTGRKVSMKLINQYLIGDKE